MNDAKALGYVRAIARTGSISLAAAELGISQPALSSALKKTEKQLGSLIFDRTATPLALTNAGQAYLDYADNVSVLKRDLMRKVSDIENLRSGELVVGGVGTFNFIYLPQALATFAKRFPNIDVYVVDKPAPEMERAALEGKIDVLVVPLMANDDAFEYEELVRERVFLCVPPHWPIVDDLPAIGSDGFARIREPELGLLRNCPFITMLDDQVVGKKLKALLQAHSINLQRTIQANQMVTCLALTMKGVGISLVAESALACARLDEMPALYLLDESACTRVLYAARAKSRYTSIAAREFTSILKQTVANIELGALYR